MSVVTVLYPNDGSAAVPALPAAVFALPTPEDFLHSASRLFGIPVADIVGPSRARPIVDARHVTVHAIRQALGLSFPGIGRLIHRDHSSAMNAQARVERIPSLRKLSDDLVAVTVPDQIPTSLEILVDALRVIGTDCRTYRLPSTCIDNGRTRGARYGADAWCDGCIARDALEKLGIT